MFSIQITGAQAGQSFSTQSFPVRSSYVMQGLCEKVALFLSAARERTITEGNDLLDGLSSFRKTYIEDFGGKELSLSTVDGQMTNGLHFAGGMKKAIIFLHGNGCFYETSLPKPLSWIESLKQKDHNGTDVAPHLIVFNPRGTGKSEGVIHPDTVARDMLAAFEHLVSVEGIDPNDIVIAGHSMGGFFGALGAELVQEKFPDAEINFLSDRSFSNIHSRADCKIQHEEYSKVSEFIVGSTMHQLIDWTEWNKDPVAAMERLKGRVCIIYHGQDVVIPYETSAHCALLGYPRTRSYSCLSMDDEGVDGFNGHNRDFSDKENALVVAELKRMLRIPLSPEEEHLTLVQLDP
ncbi:MAG: alpha/beta fold hydrolase [Verrucomicrobia bacterium]|nr:alpha/beta fold hydrolase [Verrucomicrobiota bacterium]